MPPQTDGANSITTESAEAAALYTQGVESLIRSSPDAGKQLLDAVTADADLAVALAAVAVDARSRGCENESERAIEQAVTAAHGITRRERQHVEIVALLLTGHVDRGRALCAAHLAEFRHDALIAHLLGP